MILFKNKEQPHGECDAAANGCSRDFHVRGAAKAGRETQPSAFRAKCQKVHPGPNNTFLLLGVLIEESTHFRLLFFPSKLSRLLTGAPDTQSSQLKTTEQGEGSASCDLD